VGIFSGEITSGEIVLVVIAWEEIVLVTSLMTSWCSLEI
jgi:hypothetical protein